MRRFPPDFRWGTATSSHQVEGNNVRNDWWLFEQQPGRIHDGNRSGLACDWWRNAEADFDRMAALYLNAHRLSIEWSRLEPEPDRWDDAAAGRYQQMLGGLRSRGIEPMVTLHHFTLPQWVAAAGGWEAPDAVAWFARYARRCAEWLGEFTEHWVPINEPNIVMLLGYLIGRFPPAVRDPFRAPRVTQHLLEAPRPRTARCTRSSRTLRSAPRTTSVYSTPASRQHRLWGGWIGGRRTRIRGFLTGSG